MDGIKLPVRVDFTLDEQPLIDADGDFLYTEEIAAVLNAGPTRAFGGVIWCAVGCL